jgi:hypothetical protein
MLDRSVYHLHVASTLDQAHEQAEGHHHADQRASHSGPEDSSFSLHIFILYIEVTSERLMPTHRSGPALSDGPSHHGDRLLTGVRKLDAVQIGTRL